MHVYMYMLLHVHVYVLRLSVRCGTVQVAQSGVSTNGVPSASISGPQSRPMPSDGPVLTRSASNREGEDLPPGDVAKLSSITNLKTAKLTLYQFDQSPPCWKVRALLHYYEIPYLSVTAYPGGKVEGLDNTYGKIPKLVVNDVQINDSAVVFRSLCTLLTGKPLTEVEVELEKRNNIRGMLGALEKESFSSYFGIVGAVKGATADFHSWSYAAFKPVRAPTEPTLCTAP